MGYIGSLLIFYSMYLVGQKNKNGFLVALVGEVFWFIRGWQLGAVDLAGLAIAFTLVYIRNYFKWKKDERA